MTKCALAEKVLSNSPGLVDFVTRLLISILNLPDGQMKVFGQFKLQKKCNKTSSKSLFRLDEMTFGLVHASYSLIKL